MKWNANDLENVNCDLCGCHDNVLIYSRPDKLSVVRCTKCDLVYLNPRPRWQALQQLYERGYFSMDVADTRMGYAGYLDDANRECLQQLARDRLLAVRRTIPIKGAQCVEIGCASGEFCGTLAGHGANVTGIDLSVEAIAIAKDRHPGVTFVRGTLEDYASTTQIDVLFAFELIEHVTSPMVFLRTAAARLTSGGYVVLSTPNLSCGERVGFGSWLGFNSSMEHLYFFDVNTLHAYGRALGLQLVQSFTGHGDGRIDREPPKPRPFRKAVREVLRYSGLLSTAKTAREFLGRWRPQYTDDRYAHNLVVILRKPL